MRTPFFLFLFAVVVMAGCKSSSTSTNGPATINPPGTGSYFITVSTQTDSTGTVVNMDTEKDVILATNVSIYGKTGVSVDLDSGANGWSSDTGYTVYESDGDVSSYLLASNEPLPNEWINFPVASQTSATWFNVDSSFAPFDRARLIGSTSGAGTGGAAVSGQSLSCEKINFTVIINDTETKPTHLTSSANIVTTYWYAPSIAYIVESDQPGYLLDGYFNPAMHSQLISYSLK